MVILDPVPGGGQFNIRAGLYLDEHLTRPIVDDIPQSPGDRTFVGIELIDITNPTMVIIINRLWLTRGTADPDDPEAVLLISKDVTGCATVTPMLSNGYPAPISFDPSDPTKHPHLAFEIDPIILASESRDMVYIHYKEGCHGF